MDKFSLAKYIISRYQNEITPMKLQKLMYYCYAWQLVAKEKKFDANFEAWTHGPVEREIYEKYKSFGRNTITYEKVQTLNEPIIDFILDSYSVFSAMELSQTTHLEEPWKKFKDTNRIIPDNELFEFYNLQPFAKNFPLDREKKFYPPKTTSHYSFTFDMEEEFVPVFDSLEEYLQNFSDGNKRIKTLSTWPKFYEFKN